jgi:hypothetical protein
MPLRAVMNLRELSSAFRVLFVNHEDDRVVRGGEEADEAGIVVASWNEGILKARLGGPIPAGFPAFPGVIGPGAFLPRVGILGRLDVSSYGNLPHGFPWIWLDQRTRLVW